MYPQKFHIQGTLATEANLTRNNIQFKDFQKSLDSCPKFAQLFQHQIESRYTAPMAFLFPFAFDWPEATNKLKILSKRTLQQDQNATENTGKDFSP